MRGAPRTECLDRTQKAGSHGHLCDLTVLRGQDPWSKVSFKRRRKSNCGLVVARHRLRQVKYLSILVVAVDWLPTELSPGSGQGQCFTEDCSSFMQSTMQRRFSQPQEQVLINRQDVINKKVGMAGGGIRSNPPYTSYTP